MHGGRPLYIDHKNKRTQWERPTTRRPQSASTSEGYSTPPHHKPAGGGSGRLMASAADLLGRLQRSSPPKPGEGGSSPQARSSSFGSLGQLMMRERSSPDLTASVPLTQLSPLGSSSGGGAAAAAATPRQVCLGSIGPCCALRSTSLSNTRYFWLTCLHWWLLSLSDGSPYVRWFLPACLLRCVAHPPASCF